LSQNRTLDVGAGVGIEVTLDTVDVDRSVVDTWYDAAGTAAAGDAAHVAAGDPHPQYAKSDGSRGEFEVKGAVAGHEAKPDPHPQYLLRSEAIPLPQVATWSALPPATTDDIGRRIHVTGPGGWLVAQAVADPTPRWVPTADSDTGWRDVSASLGNNGETTKSLQVRRIGDVVHARLNLQHTDITNVLRLIATGGWPSGFRPRSQTNVSLNRTGWATQPTPSGIVTLYSLGLYYRLTDTSALTGSWSYMTTDPWPTTLPGTAV
jgi:hypothetical protein